MKKLQLFVALFLVAGTANVFASNDKKTAKRDTPLTAQQIRQARADKADNAGRYTRSQTGKAKDLRREAAKNPLV